MKYSGGKITRRRARGSEKRDEKHRVKRVLAPKRLKKMKSFSARKRAIRLGK